jgi:thiamine pyrophosphokinase
MLKVTPDLIIGDFDSLGYVPNAGNVVELNSEKDDTDTMAAVRIGLDMGFSVFYIHFGMGGRLDHTIANIQTLAFIQQNRGFGILFGVNQGVVLIDESIGFSEQMSGYISVFSYTREASGVCLEGFKYELVDGVLTNSFPVGCSNEFVGQKSRISIKEGILLAVFQNKSKGSNN